MAFSWLLLCLEACHGQVSAGCSLAHEQTVKHVTTSMNKSTLQVFMQHWL